MSSLALDVSEIVQSFSVTLSPQLLNVILHPVETGSPQHSDVAKGPGD